MMKQHCGVASTHYKLQHTMKKKMRSTQMGHEKNHWPAILQVFTCNSTFQHQTVFEDEHHSF